MEDFTELNLQISNERCVKFSSIISFGQPCVNKDQEFHMTYFC